MNSVLNYATKLRGSRPAQAITISDFAKIKGIPYVTVSKRIECAEIKPIGKVPGGTKKKLVYDLNELETITFRKNYDSKMA